MATEQKQDIELGITRYEYGDAARAQHAVLAIETGKGYNGGLRSAADVFWIGQHSRSRMLSFAGDKGGDYSKRLRVTDRAVKATQKAIDRQHAEVFTPDVVAVLAQEAKAFYARVIEAGTDGFRNVYPKVAK